MRGLLVGIVVLALVSPAVGDAAAPVAKKPPAKTKLVCKKKKKKVRGKTKRVCVRKKVVAKKKPAAAKPAPATPPAERPPAESPPPAPAPAPEAAAPAPAPAPAPTTTRDDAAGRAALGSDDLLLERFEGGSASYTYYRLFLYANGSFKYSIVDYTQPSGEICRSEGSSSGSWTFKEGYRFTTADGRAGSAAVITTPKGDEVLGFFDGDARNVYVGRNETAFERNPNMRDQC